MQLKKVLIGMMAIFVSLGAAIAADPTISDVIIQQRWPWRRLVDIDYVLTCELGQSIDINVSAYNGSVLLDLPQASFSGDLYAVQRGARRIVWDPTMTTYINNGVLPEFRVVLTPTPTPLYMIVNLTKLTGEVGQIEYVYESDLTNDLWGAWERDPVINKGTVVQSVVWTGVTTNDIYKTDKLVLRRISKGTFKMGGITTTTLTKDFYAGVFQVTQRQWELIMGEGKKPSFFSNPEYYKTRPVEQVSYDGIRGALNSSPSVNWPETGGLVLPSSFMGQLRVKTGLTDFDLSTEAQWEYACRADTTTIFNDGDASAGTSGTTNEWLDALGRYQFNGGYVDGVTSPLAGYGPANGTAIVGSYLPNAWGLYDTHGNVYEWCLNWSGSSSGGSDPVGPESGNYRRGRGGSWRNPASSCSATGGNLDPPSALKSNYGFRLFRTLP